MTGMESAKRKRAAKACNYCRKRKRKCDGRQPVCTLCEEANNSECEYRDEGNESKRIAISVDRVDEIFDRLESLESTFHSAIARQRDRSPVSTPYAAYPVSRHGEAISPEDVVTSSVHSTGPGTQTSLTQFANNNVFNTTMDIPLSHSSTTGNLLRSAPAKALLGHYPSDLFLHIELRRPVPEGLRLNAVPASQIDLPTLSTNETDHLVRNYFQLVHRFHPILDQRAFYDLYDRTVEHGPRPDLASSLVLVVLALGAVAAETPNRMDPCWSPGLRYFTPAVRLLLTESLCSFGGDPLLPQALYLAALYYSYLSRPLLAWRLVHMASTDVQHYWIRSEKLLRDGQGGSQDQSILRVFWAILVLECDILAEHHLPRSGIEKIVDKLPYPWSDGPSEPYMHRWLADLSSRRLLNRIHYVLYAEAEPGTGDNADNSEETQSSLPNLAHELNRQLGAWYHLLPHSIRPNLETPPIGIDDTMDHGSCVAVILRGVFKTGCITGPGSKPIAGQGDKDL
ncbi:c6 finger protein [Fusarium austroafricanum]|uniref:C6 finger protein n=1 Tax=Fusarium austroafricanum TaxID=2364996 RepID=A0A8H4KVJ8_9HYPO|nr:c6 finger protein [Fusarium austroafricanum]